MSNKKIKHNAPRKDLSVRVKTARYRKASSTRWLQRQLNDPYVQAAQKQGYRSRAAFKLLQLDEKYDILPRRNQDQQEKTMIIDLGAAPGGWTQIVADHCGHDRVIGLDILPMEPIDGVHLIEADCQSEETFTLLTELLDGRPVSLILSDMAAPTIGHPQTDQIRTLALAEMAFAFAEQFLSTGGHFVTKIFQGGAGRELLDQLKQNFNKIHHFKPDASRKDSVESYLVALDFKGSDK